jgi:FkbM family methyltransferase
MSWAFHIRDGIRENGHEADVVTFTRSGKVRKAWGEGNMRPGIRWWGKVPDVVGKLTEAAATLDTYDAVILTDVRTVMHDKDAISDGAYLVADIPDYITVLSGTKTPFTFALHGNNYHENEVPFVEKLLALDNMCGAAVTHSPTSNKASWDKWSHLTWFESPLPYRMRTKPDDDTLAGAPLDPSAPSDIVGITGRYITTKGPHALAMATAKGHLTDVDEVQLWGASSLSLAASATYKTFEALHLGKPYELEGVRHGVIKPGQRTETGGDVIRAYLWEITAPDGTQISYNGGYEDGFTTCRKLNVHVDLTASSFSDGMEYSQFESIDAGCLQVSVKSMWSDDFQGVAIESVDRWPAEAAIEDDVLRRIGDGVNRVLTADEAQRRRMVRHNRSVLHYKHAPKVVAQTFIEALGDVAAKRVDRPVPVYAVNSGRVSTSKPSFAAPRIRKQKTRRTAIGVYENVPRELVTGYHPLWHRCVGVPGKAYGRTTAVVEPSAGVLDYFTAEPVDNGTVTLEPQVCMVRLQAMPGDYTVTFTANDGETYTHNVTVIDPKTTTYQSQFRDGNVINHRTSKYDEIIIKDDPYRDLPIHGVVLDCGAHVGTFTRDAMSRGATEVVAIEPEPVNYALLTHNTKIDGVSHYQAAIVGGESTGDVALYMPHVASNHGNSSLYDAKSHHPVIQVAACSFPDTLQRLKPNTVKMSVEGAERDVNWAEMEWPAETTAFALVSDDEFLINTVNPALQTHGFTTLRLPGHDGWKRSVGIWTRESKDQG